MNLTYVLGAGASANSLPLVRSIGARIRIFVEHLKAMIGLTGDEENRLMLMINQIEKHYTIDTYAKKLFLKKRVYKKELNELYDFMGAYFIYEQLRKDESDEISKYLYEKAHASYEIKEIYSNYSSIIESVDYRYDSLFATLLKPSDNNDVFLPNNINIISWNYDSQVEISYMNFIEGIKFDEVQEKLNIFPSPNADELTVDAQIVKINGTAGFYSDTNKYGDLFDFNTHILNRESMTILKNILFQKNNKYQNSIYFSWNEDEKAKKARLFAKNIISSSDILVIIGYSFPYFNRDVDSFIFSALEGRSCKIYIQTKENTFESIKNRAIGATYRFKEAVAFSELDQFLIPNDFK